MMNIIKLILVDISIESKSSVDPSLPKIVVISSLQDSQSKGRGDMTMNLSLILSLSCKSRVTKMTKFVN